MTPQYLVEDVESTLEEAGWQQIETSLWSPGTRISETDRSAILATLLDQPPWLEARLLYDSVGSHLFEDISRLPEYYLTRTEQEILARAAGTIVSAADSELIVELGAGFSVKTRTLLRSQLERCQQTTFVPIDVSLTALRASRDSFQKEFPDLQFVGLHGDSEAGLRALGQHRKMVLFLGSSIGNFAGSDLQRFWHSMQNGLLAGDTFLVGVDHTRAPHEIEAAYNDASGVTEAFIRNVLEHLNRLLEADFSSADFDYRARYSQPRGRVELKLVARRRVRVRCRRPAHCFEWAAGTPLLVEVSRKFEPSRLVQQAGVFGFRLRHQLSDDCDRFSVLLLQRVPEDAAPQGTL